MANYYATSRTNTFSVKEPQAFRAWADRLGVRIHQRNEAGGFVLDPGEGTDSGAFPSHDPETDEEIDFAGQLSAHLAEGNVAVIVEIGSEKLRYLHGHAVAVNSQGKQVHVDLGHIYALAEITFGGPVSRAEY